MDKYKKKEKKIFDFAISKKIYNDLIKLFRDNGIDILDEDLVKEVLDKDTLIYEKKFFKNIDSVLKEDYPSKNVELIFSSQIGNFSVITRHIDNYYLIICSSFFYEFINRICLYILSYYDLLGNKEITELRLRKMKNYIIGIIDIMTNRKTAIKFDKYDLELFSNEQLAIKSAIIARNIQAFVICHELGHVMIDDNLEINKYDSELLADQNGIRLFCKLINKLPSEYNIHLDYSSAPLIFFDIFDLVFYFKKIILDIEDSSDYPKEKTRIQNITSFYNANLSNEISDFFYSLFHNIILEIKCYLYTNQEAIRYNIKKMYNE